MTELDFCCESLDRPSRDGPSLDCMSNQKQRSTASNAPL